MDVVLATVRVVEACCRCPCLFRSQQLAQPFAGEGISNSYPYCIHPAFVRSDMVDCGVSGNFRRSCIFLLSGTGKCPFSGSVVSSVFGLPARNYSGRLSGGPSFRRLVSCSVCRHLSCPYYHLFCFPCRRPSGFRRVLPARLPQYFLRVRPGTIAACFFQQPFVHTESDTDGFFSK